MRLDPDRPQPSPAPPRHRLQPAAPEHAFALLRGTGGPRPAVRGPFLCIGDDKFIVRGVTYGTFAADGNGDLFPPPAVVRADFALMRAAHVNTIRTYTPPPDWLLEEARAAGLRVLIGIHWEATTCCFDDARALQAATTVVRDAVARCRAFPDVVLAYAIGNEIPPLVVRLHGRPVIYRFLQALYETAKREDPDGLVTYGNFPSTEYLALDFLDFQTANVYLREARTLGSYLDRLLIETRGQPLLLGEVGDDSIRRGTSSQAELLDWTLQLAFEKGCCGVAVFAWTDDWVVGGHRVADWQFGLVDAGRRPKAAYEVVARRFAQAPFGARTSWPRVSVVVCNYNGGATLDETLSSLAHLRYPDYEVVLVDDGSTDDSLAIAARHRDHVRLVVHDGHRNLGLSASRNVGAEVASGEIVAYIDSDAFADADWLHYLVATMLAGGYAGAGGPNLTPASDGLIAQFLAMCPGNPTHVLLDNVRADHLPGVNMAFRRDLLLALGGFDPVHRAAGDDVDLCWRLRDQGLTLAFSPAAIVWHHRRPSLRRYFRQQAGYGVAENQLERKHPDRFTGRGRIRWSGRVYTAPRRASALLRPFVYHGFLGTGFFQTLYHRQVSLLDGAPATIEFYLLWLLLLAMTPLSPWFLLVGGALLALSVASALFAGWTAQPPVVLSPPQRRQKFAVVALVHFLHPIVRTYGRLAARLRAGPRENAPPRRRRRPFRGALAELRTLLVGHRPLQHYWGPGSSQRVEIMRQLQRALRTAGISATFGTEWDDHDLQVGTGPVTQAHVCTAPEHYDRALCVRVAVVTAPTALLLLLGLAAGIIVLAATDARWSWWLVLPLLLGAGMLSRRRSLRQACIDAVATVMQQHGAVPFDNDAPPVPRAQP